jgi:SAM-dependent methyltransferase
VTAEGRTEGAARASGACLEKLAKGHRPPLRQWRASHLRRRQRLLEKALDCEALVEALREGRRLPAGYGYGFDERSIEYPWLLAAEPSGRTLDAGSILNHSYILPHFLTRLDLLVISTLAPEPTSFPELGVSYVYGDMRELPFADGWFDTVVSLSTLEHIGMDNVHYGDDSSLAPDPHAEMKLALSELRRVTKPGGRILISVPFGKRTDMGWSRQLDKEEIDDLIAALQPSSSKLEVYAYSRDGWNLSDPADAADAAYHDFTKEARWPEDKAAAARAVACVDLRL